MVILNEDILDSKGRKMLSFEEECQIHTWGMHEFTEFEAPLDWGDVK